MSNLAETYDANYRRDNYFEYESWMYRPFIRALIKKAALKRGDRVLDAGCGQGFFSKLICDLGFDVVGVDLSVEGIKTARRNCSNPKAEFGVADIMSLPYESTFDCVYNRSCSLYNRRNLQECGGITETLFRYVKPGGVLIFDYYTKLSPREESRSWTYHQLGSIKEHFARFPQAKVYFSLRLETFLLGTWALTGPMTLINSSVSRLSGMGGEVIALIWKR